MRVVVLGASDKPERYSYKAFKMLQEYGHSPVLVSPTLKSLEGFQVFSDLSNVSGKVDTLTVYVNPGISSQLQAKILSLKPERVVFNPGSENPELMKALDKAGIPVLEACTLVLLRTGQF